MLEARAQLGIAVGGLYPQQQTFDGAAIYSDGSRNAAGGTTADLSAWQYSLGANVGWELDFWGRFRRGVESADAARRSALRSTAIVVPVLLWLLFTSETASYAVVLLKVATMGQQSELEDTRSAARDLLQSTLVGGVAAVIVWNVLQIWPNLIMYSLLFLLCGLIMGPKIFAGAGLAPRGSMWSYGLLTMMVIIAPAAMDTPGGDAAGARFSDRIVMFALATLYAVAAVYVFDRFWPDRVQRF